MNIGTNNYNPQKQNQNFKMKLSPEFLEQLKTKHFMNNKRGFELFQKSFNKIHNNTEPTTVVDLLTLTNQATGVKTSKLIFSSEIDMFRGYKMAQFDISENGFHNLTKDEMKILPEYLLSMCTRCTSVTEMKLYAKAIQDKIAQFTPLKDIRKIAQSFQRNVSEKTREYEQLVEEMATKTRREGGYVLD